MLRSARTVIANNQGLINEPSSGDKGFTGQVVITKVLKNFRERLGANAPAMTARVNLHNRERAVIASRRIPWRFQSPPSLYLNLRIISQFGPILGSTPIRSTDQFKWHPIARETFAAPS